MRRICLIAMLVLAADGAGGQQSGAPKPVSAAGASSATARVKIYSPSSSVKAPRLLPLDPPPALTKDCEKNAEGEALLSILVDTSGRARNVMFLKPAGSAVDRFAIQIASQDRFAPGTLDGEPVVVAESLRVKVEMCDETRVDKGGNLALNTRLKSLPRQKLEKPKDPPEEAILAPLHAKGGVTRTVRRPDFFGTDVSAPVILYSQDAPYMPARAGTQISGECKLGLVVDAHGLPEDIHVLKSIDPGLDLSAVLAVNMYRFFPAIRNGEEPVPAAIVVSVEFAPPGSHKDKVATAADDGQEP
jgi:TonB family protein